MSYVIETERLTKMYGSSVVVRDVSIHVPEAKIYALLGRNGAGKTTLMKMLLKLVGASKGTIYLFGENSERADRKIFRKIGAIIETPGFYENLTADENLGLLMRLRGRGDQGDLKRALEIVGLQNEYAKVFAEYSLGMKQRLGIAAAMMLGPQLLILDEPINGLDPIGISEIRGLLASLCRERGTTIFISSHVLSEIDQIADVVGVMHEGRLIEETDMPKLRARSRRYVEIEVSEPARAMEILKESFDIKDCVVQGKRLKLYDLEQQSGLLNKTLVNSGLCVSEIHTKKENLEDYFTGLIGGGGIA